MLALVSAEIFTFPGESPCSTHLSMSRILEREAGSMDAPDSYSISSGLFSFSAARPIGLHATESDAADRLISRTKSVNPTPLKRRSSQDVSRFDRMLRRRVSLGGKCQGLHLDSETEQKATTIGRTIAHAAAETYLITRLALILIRSFG